MIKLPQENNLSKLLVVTAPVHNTEYPSNLHSKRITCRVYQYYFLLMISVINVTFIITRIRWYKSIVFQMKVSIGTKARLMFGGYIMVVNSDQSDCSIRGL